MIMIKPKFTVSALVHGQEVIGLAIAVVFCGRVLLGVGVVEAVVEADDGRVVGPNVVGGVGLGAVGVGREFGVGLLVGRWLGVGVLGAAEADVGVREYGPECVLEAVGEWVGRGRVVWARVAAFLNEKLEV